MAKRWIGRTLADSHAAREGRVLTGLTKLFVVRTQDRAESDERVRTNAGMQEVRTRTV